MKNFEVTKQISYCWWHPIEIKPEHIQALKESAESRIEQMTKEGYISGRLNDNIRMTDDDPEDGIEYRGSWEVKEFPMTSSD